MSYNIDFDGISKKDFNKLFPGFLSSIQPLLDNLCENGLKKIKKIHELLLENIDKEIYEKIEIEKCESPVIKIKPKIRGKKYKVLSIACAASPDGFCEGLIILVNKNKEDHSNCPREFTTDVKGILSIIEVIKKEIV